MEKPRKTLRSKLKSCDDEKDQKKQPHLSALESLQLMSERTLQDIKDNAIPPQTTADDLAILLNKDLRLPADLNKMEICGKEIYGFQTPKKKTPKPLLAAKSPKSSEPVTKRIYFNVGKIINPKQQVQVPKTPFKLRRLIRTQIAKMVRKQLDDTLDFSNDEDDNYSPSENDSISTEDASESSHEKSSDAEVEHGQHSAKNMEKEKISETVMQEMKSSLRRSCRLQMPSKLPLTSNDQDGFVPESDCYFRSHAPTKSKTSSKGKVGDKRPNKQGTSSNTLEQLHGSRVSNECLVDLMGQLQHSTEHKNCIEEIIIAYRENYFHKWCVLLQEGYSILVYGLGSKRALLQSFHEEWLKEECVLVVNGFFPSLTLKDIFDHIMQDILGISGASGTSNLNEAIDIIEQEMQGGGSRNDCILNVRRLFLLIHNLDGPMLRNGRAQTYLSRLSRIPNVHLVASIDHINTPLLWNQTKLSNFNFSWWDCSTLLSYREETAFENSLLVQNSDDLALASMRSVFLSLTNNARGIYLTIVRYQIKFSKSNTNYQGMAFKDLYRSCRESFLVSSDLTLRSQLTEFLDHKLVKTKRSFDGLELLIIPIDYHLLQQFADEHDPK